MKKIPAIPTFVIYRSNRKIYDKRLHTEIKHEDAINQIIETQGKFAVSGRYTRTEFLKRLLIRLEEQRQINAYDKDEETRLLSILLSGGYYKFAKDIQNAIKLIATENIK